MNAVTYETLVANIAHVAVEGTSVRVTWTCPATGRAMGESTATMSPDATVGGRVRASVKRSIAGEIINSSARFLASLLPGAAGRVLNNAVYTAAADINAKATSGVDYSEATRRAAIVGAFESVRPNFVWDEPKQRFVAR
jgi:hypothetical protein